MVVVKTDISNIKSSNEDILKSIKGINIKISDLYAKAKELLDKGDRTIALETRINNINTKLTSKDEELRRDITELQKDTIRDVNNIKATSLDTVKYIRELDEKIIKTNTKITNVESTSVNAIQIINAANKTLNEDLSSEI